MQLRLAAPTASAAAAAIDRHNPGAPAANRRDRSLSGYRSGRATVSLPVCLCRVTVACFRRGVGGKTHVSFRGGGIGVGVGVRSTLGCRKHHARHINDVFWLHGHHQLRVGLSEITDRDHFWTQQASIVRFGTASQEAFSRRTSRCRSLIRSL